MACLFFDQLRVHLLSKQSGTSGFPHTVIFKVALNPLYFLYLLCTPPSVFAHWPVGVPVIYPWLPI